MAHLPSIGSPADFARVFGVSRETIARLETYQALLERWSHVKDLVAPGTMSQIWYRHFTDSAQLIRLAPDARCWLDLGSGAGFPGLVVAILLKGTAGVRVGLVESNARKCAFLRDVARQTGAPVDIFPSRIQELATQNRVDNYDVVTARALAPLGELLELATPFFRSETVGLFLKGRTAADEVREASRRWDFVAELHESLTESEARIVEIRRLMPRRRS
ncbi:MAG: 16S rRNA (guanine(527)-N(7))-methyltransferase RsmG [Hyphomicrobiaceae bacterium]